MRGCVRYAFQNGNNENEKRNHARWADLCLNVRFIIFTSSQRCVKQCSPSLPIHSVVQIYGVYETSLQLALSSRHWCREPCTCRKLAKLFKHECTIIFRMIEYIDVDTHMPHTLTQQHNIHRRRACYVVFDIFVFGRYFLQSFFSSCEKKRIEPVSHTRAHTHSHTFYQR